ncbi:MAG TPA: M48 family metallopeptidase [Burkholderiales bacterium]|nr:M48 family metallopeptidase [Burkholderiales bacterium]
MKGPGLFFLLALLAGCATNQVTGRSQLMLVSEQQAIGSSAAAYTSMMGQLGKKKKIEGDTARVRRVREITERLIAQAVKFRPDSAAWKWDVRVIDDPKTVNAFCMAGGKMAIYSGMWEKLKATDDEVAQVMGHEIGHALASHTRERMSVAYSSGIGTQVLAIALGARPDSAALMQTAAALAIQLPNSRESESEADQIGIELAARAGYDPQAALSLWDKMGKLGGSPPEFLSTHPSPEHRAERLRELRAKVEPLYLAARGKPPEAPSFLSAKEGANERVVTRPGEPTREEYAAQAANEAGTLTFLAEPFERFRNGEARFDCRVPCALAYARGKGNWRKLHAGHRWRDLAVSVMQVGYLSDLSYFMLAESARSMGLRDASLVYYRRAAQAGKQYGCGDPAGGCEGFDVPKLAASALGR